MWFKVSKEQDPRFPAQYILSNTYWLNADDGWQEIHTLYGFAYIKGYCFERGINHVLAEELFENPIPRYTGSFVAVLAYKDGRVVITNDTTRATPLYRDDANLSVGNLCMQTYENVWSDAYVEIAQHIQEHRWNAVPVPKPTRLFDSVVDEIHNLLCAKFNWLAMNHDIVRVFYSGGIDTLTCISYLRALHVPFELVTAEHFDLDDFVVYNDSEIRSYWGYNQIHHYRRPTIFVTGACGDEYFMRGPATANIMLMHLGKSMQQVLAPNHYHYLYFQGLEKSQLYDKQSKNIEILKAIKNRQTTNDYILRMCINDHQHWHLGNTITFTPFKDLELLRLTLELDEQNILSAIVDASIQRALIHKNEPALIDFLAKNKNQDRSGIMRLSNFLNS